MLSPGTRVPLSRSLGGGDDLLDEDGTLRVVRRWRVASSRLRAWLLPYGAWAIGGAILLLVRNVDDRSVPLTVVLLVSVALIVGVVVGQIRIRTHTDGGFRRLCFVEAQRDAIGGGVLTPSRSSKGVASLVVLPAGRGVALIGDSSLALRDAGIHVEIECSLRGSVCYVRLAQDDRECRLNAWGKVPLSALHQRGRTGRRP